jgi:hypothetical protein
MIEVPEKQLMSSLVLALGEMEAPLKDKRADAGARAYNYATLAAVMEVAKPALARHGLALTQSVEVDGEKKEVEITTTLLHVSGAERVWRPVRMPVGQWTPQGLGSAITYARRYSALSVLGLAPEDDDAQAAMPAQRPTQLPAPKSQPQLPAPKSEPRPLAVAPPTTDKRPRLTFGPQRGIIIAEAPTDDLQAAIVLGTEKLRAAKNEAWIPSVRACVDAIELEINERSAMVAPQGG